MIRPPPMPTSRTVQGRRQINASLLKPFGLAAKGTLAGDQPLALQGTGNPERAGDRRAVKQAGRAE
jgi:hypothetical protein